MLRLWMMTVCASVYLSGCAEWVGPEERPGGPALFKDAQSEPPKVSERTVDYLIENERPFAGWLAETIMACEEHGCRPR